MIVLARAKAADPPPAAGDIVTIGERLYLIVDVTPRMTPFRKKDQNTTIEGYTLSLHRLPGLVGQA